MLPGKVLSRCVGLTLLTVGFFPAAAAQGPPPASPFYPLKVGTVWHYRNKSEKIAVRVVALEKVGEQMWAKVEAEEKGSKKIEYVAMQADGIYRTKIQDKEIKPALCILKLPPMKGQTWKIASEVGGVKIKGTFLTEEEEVTVPAGKFKAFKVSSKDFVLGSRAMALTYWFAEGKGIVKQRLEWDGFDLILELEKFEPGK